MQDSLYIIIPAYNEEENIEQLITDWYPIIESHNSKGNSRLVVIDDGSKDNTLSILQKLAVQRPFLIPLTKDNSGHGPTVLYGYRYAIENKAEFIFQTDADGQTNPDEFENFWEKRNEYDAVIGCRSVRGDGKSRKFVENVVCALLKVFFGVSVKDANAPFRLMKADCVKEYIQKLPEDFNLPNIMLTTYFCYFNNKVKFIDISFAARKNGTNSINIRKIVKIGAKALGDFSRLRKTIDR